MKKKKDELMKAAKDTIKVGGVTMVGGAVIGGMSGMSGMPAQAGQTAGIAMSGLHLANVGQLAKTGLTVTRTIAPASTSKKPRTRPTSRTGNIVNKILGR